MQEECNRVQLNTTNGTRVLFEPQRRTCRGAESAERNERTAHRLAAPRETERRVRVWATRRGRTFYRGLIRPTFVRDRDIMPREGQIVVKGDEKREKKEDSPARRCSRSDRSSGDGSVSSLVTFHSTIHSRGTLSFLVRMSRERAARGREEGWGRGRGPERGQLTEKHLQSRASV